MGKWPCGRLLREISMFDSPLLQFADVASFPIEAGVDDEAWLKAEEEIAAPPDDDGQMLLL